MSKMLYVAPLAALLLASCVVVPKHGAREVVIVPALPHIVELGAEPYYFHGGYYYHYHNARWSYSRARTGPWIDLPRDHYPREIRYRDRRDGDRRDGDRD